MKSLLVVVATALLALTACADNAEDSAAVDEWCSNVEQAAEKLEEAGAIEADSPNDLDAMKARFANAMEARELFEQDAPEEIAKKTKRYWAIDEDTRRISEQEEREELSQQITEYVREECDLDFKF